MTLSLGDRLSRRKEDSEHFKKDQDRLLEVRGTIFESLSVQVALVSLALIFLEADEFVCLQVLEVAQRKELFLVLELWNLRDHGRLNEREKRVLLTTSAL